MSCGVGSIPFTFLGVKVWINPRKKSAWKNTISKIQRRLYSWKGKYLSQRGRITMINVVWTNLPIYPISFYKAPKEILKEIINIQLSFSWGGEEDKRKVFWVSYDSICKNKKEKGLGIKHCSFFNQTLLSKWLLRIISDPSHIWKYLLSFRYGDVHSKIMDHSPRAWNNRDLIWWISQHINCKLGKTNMIGFGDFKWLGMEPLSISFPSIYQLSVNSEAKIADMGAWISGEWQWLFHLDKEILDLEETIQLVELDQIWLQVSPYQCSEDNFILWHDNGRFSVKSAYVIITTFNA